MELIYNFGTFLIFVVLGGMVAGLIKPALLARVLRRHATRRGIAVIGLATFFVLCGVVSASEPASVRQARLDKEKSAKQTVQVQAKPQEEQPKIETKEIQAKQTIPFSKEQRNDATLASGQTKISQTGHDGEKIITYSVTYKDGQQTARTIKGEAVTIQPINEITLIGTYIAPAPTPAPALTPTYSAPSTTAQTSTTRTGATCRDGWHSTATGSGACSHHGGVAQWLYN